MPPSQRVFALFFTAQDRFASLGGASEQGWEALSACCLWQQGPLWLLQWSNAVDAVASSALC